MGAVILSAPDTPLAAALLAATTGAATAVLLLTGAGTVPHRLAALLPGQPPAARPAWSLLVRLVRRVDGTWRRRGEARAWRAEVIELCTGFAAELAAGRTAEEALTRAAHGLDGRVKDGFAPVIAAARFGGDVAASLDHVAHRPGAAGLRLLAVCWRVGVDRGGALVPVVDGLAMTLRDEEACGAEVEAQLAGPRATATLLAVLPVLGLTMAAALGARPLSFLFGTWPGAGCLLVAVALDVLGLWWALRIMRAAGRVQ